MVNNQQRPDSMPDWQEAGVGVHNGVGGAPGTHEGHARVVPMRDDMTTPGDDQTGYGAA